MKPEIWWAVVWVDSKHPHLSTVFDAKGVPVPCAYRHRYDARAVARAGNALTGFQTYTVRKIEIRPAGTPPRKLASS